jgi:hypothetical protein
MTRQMAQLASPDRSGPRPSALSTIDRLVAGSPLVGVFSDRRSTLGKLWNIRCKIGRRRALAIAPRHGICAEIGVWKGDFSQRVLETVLPKELHLVDPWVFMPSLPTRWYGGAVAKNQADMDAIMQAVMDRFAAHPEVVITRQASPAAAARFSDRYFDWIYVDGDHSYDPVLNDLEAWHPKVKPHGFICLDDYEFRDEHGQKSVQAAIDSFLKQTAVAKAKPMQGQFLIRVAH